MISQLQSHCIIMYLGNRKAGIKKSENGILLFITDLCLKIFSVQDPQSIPWVLSISTFRIQDVLFHPSRDRAVGLFVLLQLSPLTSMMSLHSAKHWEMFHFSLFSKSEVEKVFK